MDPTNPSFWERLGFPLATLIIIGLGLLRVALWIKPWAEAIFQDHREFIKRTSEMLEAQADEQRAQAATIRQLAKDMSEGRAETVRMAADIVDRLDRLIKQGGPG